MGDFEHGLFAERFAEELQADREFGIGGKSAREADAANAR